MIDKETRACQNSELRVLPSDEPRIAGYAALFETLSENLGGFREKIARGAFTRSLSADVRALWEHNSQYVIGRTLSGTLNLVEDERGLYIEATPPATTWARDLLASIERGDISQMSFGFRVIKDTWASGPDGINVRTLHEVELLDVSPVTYPAYTATSVSVRDVDAELSPAILPTPTDTGEVAQPVEQNPDEGAGEVASALDIRRLRVNLWRSYNV